MLTQMCVGGLMACTHDHDPPSKRISRMSPPAVHKCTLNQPMVSEGQLPEDDQLWSSVQPGAWRDGRLALEIGLAPLAVAALTVELAPA